jgi:hypothetical protein
MFTEIDKILYPNKCEVIQTTSHDFIYPIFKNGSSSLWQTAKKENWKILFNNQIQQCDGITVFIREPLDRYFTGINTYIKHCLDQGLEENTVIYFINNYLFLNRHYMPQMLWLINLARYSRPDVLLNFKHVNDIKNITDLTKNSSDNSSFSFIDKLDKTKLNFYIDADLFLMQYIDKSITWQDLFLKYKNECKLGYKHIFEYAEKINNALPKI